MRFSFIVVWLSGFSAVRFLDFDDIVMKLYDERISVSYEVLYRITMSFTLNLKMNQFFITDFTLQIHSTLYISNSIFWISNKIF